MRPFVTSLAGLLSLQLVTACVHEQPEPVALAPDEDALVRFDQLLVSARKRQLSADRIYDGKIYMDAALTPALVAVPVVYRARNCGIDISSARPKLESFLESRGLTTEDRVEFMSFFDAGLATLAERSGAVVCNPQDKSDLQAIYDEFNRLIEPGAEPPVFPDSLLADASEATPPVIPPATAVWADRRSNAASPAARLDPLPWAQAQSSAAVQGGSGEVLPWQQPQAYQSPVSTSAGNEGYYSRYATPEPYTPPTRADVRYAVKTDLGNSTGIPLTDDQQRRASIDAIGVDLTPWLR
jgi:hypothetical protein